jgi:hypothetical protein
MKKLSVSSGGFGVIEIVIIVSVLVLLGLAGGYVVYRYYHKNSSPVNSMTIKVSGKIASSDCPGPPDAGCSIVVDGYTVGIVHGFINTPDLGTVTGGGDFRNLVGKTAAVYGHKTDSHDIDIFSNSNYYVHITN